MSPSVIVLFTLCLAIACGAADLRKLTAERAAATGVSPRPRLAPTGLNAGAASAAKTAADDQETASSFYGVGFYGGGPWGYGGFGGPWGGFGGYGGYGGGFGFGGPFYGGYGGFW